MKATLPVLVTLVAFGCVPVEVESSSVAKTEARLWQLEIDGIGG